MRQIRTGSPKLRAAVAAARSAQNLKTRKANEREESIAESARRRRKRISDREAEAFMRRRVRVRAALEDRSRGSNRTPRKLTNRSIKEVYAGSWGNSSRCGSDGMSSIHFEFVPRGFASKKGRSWRAGEAERAGLYMTAHESLEDGELGWHSNVAEDRNELRNFWRVLEAVERHDRANANVYITEVIELPCEASPRLRRQIVKRIGARLESKGLAYVAAIHKPDRGGDQRNYHLHLMYSLRPSERIAAYEWEFGISKVGNINTKAGISERRRCVVRDINATLHAAHLGKRYTALSNGARGLEPSMQTKVGQKKTWANRRLLAVEQKVDEIHRLLAIAADLRASVERVQQAVEKAKLRVVTELHRKAREIAEREGQRATVLSEIAVKVDQAKLALQMREDRARVSAAFEELFTETMPVAPIAEIPRNSESTNARIVSNVSPKPTRRPPLPLTEAIPATVQPMASRDIESEKTELRTEPTNREQAVNFRAQPEKIDEGLRLESVQEGDQTPERHPPASFAPRQEALVRKKDDVLSEQDVLRSASKAATVTAAAGKEKRSVLAGEGSGLPRISVLKDDSLSHDQPKVPDTNVGKDEPSFTTEAKTTCDAKSPSRQDEYETILAKPVTREQLPEIVRRKSETNAGAGRKNSLAVELARQAIATRGAAVSDDNKKRIAQPADDRSPKEANKSGWALATTPDKAIAQPPRALQTSGEPKGLISAESASGKGLPDQRPAMEPAELSHKEAKAAPVAKGAPPEKVFGKRPVVPSEEDWQISKKGHER